MLKESFVREERQSGHESGYQSGHDDHQRRPQSQSKADDNYGDTGEFEQVLNVQFLSLLPSGIGLIRYLGLIGPISADMKS
jgi:hypothetical protein